MPINGIPLSVLQSKNALATTERFIWLYEVEVPSDPPTIYRLTASPQSVVFGETQQAEAIVYSPFPITHGEIDLDSSGNLPSTSLTISNVSREVIATLENYGGLLGQKVRIILAHSLAIGLAGSPVAEEEFQIVGSSADSQSVSLTLGSVDLYGVKIPKTRMTRYHCRFVYRDAGCGYALPTSDANSLLTCDKSLDGQNGCQAHGASYTAAGVTAVHPGRFGGFPGIPVNTAGGRI